jgi:hypothetical protein
MASLVAIVGLILTLETGTGEGIDGRAAIDGLPFSFGEVYLKGY